MIQPQPLTPATPLKTPLSGSSQVENVTELPTPLPHDSITTVLSLMLFNLLPKLVLGSKYVTPPHIYPLLTNFELDISHENILLTNSLRLTSNNSCKTQTHLSKRDSKCYFGSLFRFFLDISWKDERKWMEVFLFVYMS